METPKKAKPAGLQFIELVLLSKKIDFVAEHKFLKDRRFRFDLAVPDRKIAIEYEGLNFSGGKSRHLTLQGYTNDCNKYNLAILSGWNVFRFTAANYEEAAKIISILFPDKS